MIDGVLKHLAEGNSMASFAGVYGIDRNSWHRIIKKNPYLSIIRDDYLERVNQKRHFPK